MKKMIAAILAIVLCAGLLAGCAGKPDQPEAGSAGKDGKIKVVATIFPLFDWTRNIAGEEADVELMLDSGVDIHSFQPSAEDILKISECDVFVYVGGESDRWVTDALEESRNENMIVVDLMGSLGALAKEEEIVEGMQESGEHEGEDGEAEYDEHIWLSLKNAVFCCGVIRDALVQADPANAESYEANTESYTAKLVALDEQYEEAAEHSSRKVLLFGDRFPFRYMTDDYGLEYYAAFSGCEAETEASFETIMFLSDKVQELELPCVIVIEGSNRKIAETIISNTASHDQRILVLDSLQAVTKEQIQSGADYLSVMEKNLEVLKEALGQEN